MASAQLKQDFDRRVELTELEPATSWVRFTRGVSPPFAVCLNHRDLDGIPRGRSPCFAAATRTGGAHPELLGGSSPAFRSIRLRSTSTWTSTSFPCGRTNTSVSPPNVTRYLPFGSSTTSPTASS